MSYAQLRLLAPVALLVVPLAGCERASQAQQVQSQSNALGSTPPISDIDRLIATEEINQLKARYWRLMDQKKWDDFQALFTDDVVFDLREALFARDQNTGNPVLESGDLHLRPDQVAALLAPNSDWYVTGPANVRNWEESKLNYATTVHHGHSPEITITSPTTAHGYWRLEHNLRFPRVNEYPTIWWVPDNAPYHEYHGYGMYDETYEKDSRWLEDQVDQADPLPHRNEVVKRPREKAVIACA